MWRRQSSVTFEILLAAWPKYTIANNVLKKQSVKYFLFPFVLRRKTSDGSYKVFRSKCAQANFLCQSFRLGLKILLSFISKSVDPLVLYYIFYYKKIDNKKNTAKIFRHFFNWIDEIKINWYLSFLLVVASTIDSCLELGVLKCYRFVFIVC